MAIQSATQAYQLHINTLAPRNFSLADVDGFGMDVGSPAADGGGIITVSDPNFDGVNVVELAGTVAGGGWECSIEIPGWPTTFADFFGVELWLTSYHSNVATDTTLIFRGYLRERQETVRWGANTTRFTFRQAAHFMQEMGFTRGIDWYAGSASHPAPVALTTVVGHLLGHTNLGTRSPITYGFPGPTYDNLSVAQGTVYSMITSALQNATLVPWIFSRRDDGLWVTAHPNIAGPDYPNLGPVLALDEALLLELTAQQSDAQASASTRITLTKSDQTTAEAFYFHSSLGSLDTFTIRSDDIGVANYLAAAYSKHANRRYPEGVKIKTGILPLYDLGDLVELSATFPQGGHTFANQPFVVTAMTYTFDLTAANRTLTIDATLDEVVI